MLLALGVTKSHSRPQALGSQFKTLKYRPEFPARFGTIQQARDFCRDFFDWYNRDHRHSGHTPEDVHYRSALATRRNRDVLEAAHALFPERFPNGKPVPPPLPEAVWINPPEKENSDATVIYSPKCLKVIACSDHSNCVRFEARGLQEGAVTIRDLVRHALRHRPDHIVVGEVRGGEAADLLQALNTGHGGSLTTVHANNAESALSRIASCAMQGGGELPWEVTCRGVVDGIALVIHMTRREGRRFVEEAAFVKGYEAGENRWLIEPVWPPEALEEPGEASQARRNS